MSGQRSGLAADSPGTGGTASLTPAAATGRIFLLDLARSLAVLAMIGFHFGVDLELFGLAPPGMTRQGGWWWAARLIAGSFLFLAGVSLWLAHRKGLRWRAFLRRLAMVGAGAAAVSLGTYLAMPQVFVHFGILHSIALSSVIGLAFLRLNWVLVALASAAVFWLGNNWSSPAFAAPYLWWTGLAPAGAVRPSMDFEPIFPWLAAFLAGLATSKLLDSAGIWAWLSAPASGQNQSLQGLGWPGRHSLAIYLIHQPLLFAGFLGLRQIGVI